MNIKEALLEEHSKNQTIKIVKYIGSDSERFAVLVKIFLGDDRLLTQRAAWAVSYCAQQQPQLIKPYLPKLVKLLDKKDLHDAVKRNTLKILETIPVPKALQGQVANACFRFLLSQEPIAMKAYSMTVLLNICKEEPDLKNELRLVIGEMLPLGSAGIRSRGKRVLRELEKLG
jgi:hypothetical protein